MRGRGSRGAVLAAAAVVGLSASALAGPVSRADATIAGPPASVLTRHVLGAQKTAIIFAKWDTVADTFSPQSASDQLYDPTNGAEAWIREASAGAAWLTGKSGAGRADLYFDHSGAPGNQWYTLPVTWPSCDSGSSERPRDIISAAESRAETDGFAASDYQVLIVVAEHGAACRYAGQGFPPPYTNPGAVLWTENLHAGTLDHEIGHSFGLEHAGRIDCLNSSGSARVPLSGNCTAFGYGDPYDVMGASGAAYDNWRKIELGWIPQTNAIVAEGSGTYSLSHAEYPVAGATQLISVPRRDASGNVFGWVQLQVRMSYGQFDQLDPIDPARTGVIVRLSPYRITDSTGGDSAIITTDPVHGIMPLQVGKTFVDTDGHLMITTTSIANGVAQVSISTADPGATVLSVPKKGLLEVDGAGIDNDITVTKVKAVVTVHDNNGPLWIANGCVLTDAHTATCARVKTAVVNGGGGNDHLRVTGKLNSTLNGGEGDDVMTGGTGHDVFVGGAGLDTVDYSGSTRPVVAVIGGGRISGARGERDDIRADVEQVIMPAL